MTFINKINDTDEPNEYIKLNIIKVNFYIKNKIHIFFYIALLSIIINLFSKAKILKFSTKELENFVMSLKNNLTKNRKNIKNKKIRVKQFKNCEKREMLQLYIENRTQF